MISLPSKSECYASDPINQDRKRFTKRRREEDEEEEEEEENEKNGEGREEEEEDPKYRDLQSGWRKSKCRHGYTPVAIESKSSSLETRIVVITDFPCAQEYSI